MGVLYGLEIVRARLAAGALTELADLGSDVIAFGVAARAVARAGTEIVAVCPTFGPASIESYDDE